MAVANGEDAVPTEGEHTHTHALTHGCTVPPQCDRSKLSGMLTHAHAHLLRSIDARSGRSATRQLLSSGGGLTDSPRVGVAEAFCDCITSSGLRIS